MYVTTETDFEFFLTKWLFYELPTYMSMVTGMAIS